MQPNNESSDSKSSPEKIKLDDMLVQPEGYSGKAEEQYLSFQRKRRVIFTLTLTLYVLAIVVLAAVFWRAYASMQQKFATVDSQFKDLEARFRGTENTLLLIQQETEKALQEARQDNEDITRLTEEGLNELDQKIKSNAKSVLKVINRSLKRHDEVLAKHAGDIAGLVAFRDEPKSAWRNEITQLRRDLTALKDTDVLNLRRDLTTLKDTDVPNLRRDLTALKDTDVPNLRRDLTTLKDTDVPNLRRDLTTLKDTDVHNLRRDLTELKESDRSPLVANTRSIQALSNVINGNPWSRIESDIIGLNIAKDSALWKFKKDFDDLANQFKALDNRLREMPGKPLKDSQDQPAQQSTVKPPGIDKE